jgi:hypothetical protein
MRNVFLTKTLFLVVLAVLMGTAQAGLIDGTVLINRAANNRTITVRYDGVSAALVEMRVNGESVASRTVDAKTAGGETNFALNPAMLVDGDNSIEIRLYDGAGKLVATERTSIFVDRKPTGPVFMERPTAGSTVMGPVQLSLGLKQNLRNLYVSFFIDDEFTSLKNYPPYTYLWDTTRVTNGWHEVQAWVVDEANRTFKTEKMRVFVNNPGGRTNRIDPLAPPTGGNTVGDPAGLKPVATGGETVPVAGATPPTLGAATVSPTMNPVTTADPAGTKSPSVGKGDMTGQRTLLPTGTRMAPEPGGTLSANSTEPENPTKLAIREIKLGSRLEEVLTFDVTLTGKPFTFDVAPTVVEGVPFAPFRHLFEEAGGKVKWIHDSKEVEAEGLGSTVKFRIGEEFGLLNGTQFLFERAPFLQSGRTVVPLSFVSSTLKMDVQYDPNTGHVLITTSSKN